MQRRMPFLVVAVAIALRVSWVLAVPSKPVGDFAMYVESAAHLVEHGSFDSTYVYMPGYVLFVAAILSLGGGLLAVKLAGAMLGGLAAGAVYGVAERQSGGSATVALVASLLYTFWPAGIGIASVTGTDMPAAALLVFAAYFLLRFADERPARAALLFGLLTGLAAYIRAIVVPLAVLSVFVFRASGKRWRVCLQWSAVACAVAFAVLSPWALRNRLRYGETFFTDSHGGLTALVGADPNTDGRYSRSLNRMFRDVTGFTLLEEPHRQADRAALAIAKTWIAMDPLFTVGLVIEKAERLLGKERALLYWPVFRAGVLPEPHATFFARHHSMIESVADAFYRLVIVLALMGSGVAIARRRWLMLALLPQALALTALYSAIFTEPRYRLPIFILLIPLSAYAATWIGQLVGRLRTRQALPGWPSELRWATGTVVVILSLVPIIGWAGQVLREKHRFAVHECTVAGQTRLCTWRSVHREGGLAGRSALVGAWNGVGIALPTSGPGQATSVSVDAQIPLQAGEFRLSLAVDAGPGTNSPPARGRLTLFANGTALGSPIELARIPGLEDGKPLPFLGMAHHPGGVFHLSARADLAASANNGPTGRLWLCDLRLAPEEP